MHISPSPLSDRAGEEVEEGGGEGVEGGEGESEEEDERDSPPHQPPAIGYESYDGDESGNESVDSRDVSSAADFLPLGPSLQATQNPTPQTSTNPISITGPSQAATAEEPVLQDQATTAQSSVELAELVQPQVSESGVQWYRDESSSEPERDDILVPIALGMSDWSDSFTHSDSQSLHSDSSWETEDEEVIIGGEEGGSPHNLGANEGGEQPSEDWDRELGEENQDTDTASVAMAIVSLPPATREASIPRSLDAYDAHIRLDQNGTENSDELQSWETANETNNNSLPFQRDF